MFTPKHRNHWNCSPKCSYISDRLQRNFAHGLTRDEAIKYYGVLYEDPLRSLLRSKHKQLVRVIYDYCTEHNRYTFTHSEIDSLGLIKMHSQSLAVCATSIPAISKTGRKIKAGPGRKSVIEWRLNPKLLNATTRW